VAKQAEQCLKKFPNANSEITLLGAWLHDIGHYPLPEEKDHAVQGEERARKFLEKHSVEPHIIGQICHCVRAHRNKDVPPVSIEAKIVAFSDSASHLVGSMYMDMVQQGRGELVFDKMERDYKDLALLE
jgi:HD superfamily phosphodiesterase